MTNFPFFFLYLFVISQKKFDVTKRVTKMPYRANGRVIFLFWICDLKTELCIRVHTPVSDHYNMPEKYSLKLHQ